MKFVVNDLYSREDIYSILDVPKKKRRGNWETGYNSYGGDLFIFCNVGASGRSGHDYDNCWLGDDKFQWFAKERTHIDQKQIKWMLNPAGNILLFTREDNRQPFTFHGFCEPAEHEDTTPVKIVWKVHTTPTATPPQNYALINRTAIEAGNYVRRADPLSSYWFGFDQSRIEAYKAERGTAFCLVLAGAPDTAGDFYSIPYNAIAHMLTEDFATEHDGGRVRWIGDVHQHRLRISHCPTRLDIGQFYGVPILANEPLQFDDGEHDYAIENRIVEIKQRQKQSVFRKRVLENFNESCCICGVSATDLLVASYIVPWAQRIDSRLDPANGLCLFVLYDALFDGGYFTLSNDLKGVTSSVANDCPEVFRILEGISGKRLASPKNVPLNTLYLEYHRNNVFKGGLTG